VTNQPTHKSGQSKERLGFFGRQSAAIDALGNAVADLLVNLAPVFQRPFKHRVGHALFKMSGNAGYQPVALGVVHDLTHQCAGLTPVVIFLVQSISGADEFAAGLPDFYLGVALAVSLRPPLELGA